MCFVLAGTGGRLVRIRRPPFKQMIDMEIEMVAWALIIFVHAGIASSSDSMSITNVGGFTSKEACESAGNAAKSITTGTVKNTRYVCVEVK